MDAIVSARVPVAVKERGNATLRELGATPSQLINAAYEFVLAEHRLPKPAPFSQEPGCASRVLTPQQRDKVLSALDAMYVGSANDAASFKEQLDTARDERYARFA